MQCNLKQLVFVLILFWSFFSHASENLEIQKILNTYSFDKKNYTLIIENLNDPKKLTFSHNENKLFNVASLVKILTSFMAIEELGPNFQWQSDLYIQGKVEDQLLDGNVIFKGRGDASFSINDLEKMVRELRDRGIREINGNLILDTSYFGALPKIIDFDEDPMRAYNVLPNAISIQSNTMNFKFIQEKNKIHIETDPRLENFEIINKLSLSQETCRSWRSAMKYEVKQELERSAILFEGKFSKSCKNKEIDLSVMENGKYFFEIFKKLWHQNGGIFNGSYEYTNNKIDDLILIATHQSRRLSETIRDINKYSLNLMSRNLMLTMITESSATPADEGMVNRYVNDWFMNRGYTNVDLYIDNGAGLSRNIKISSKQLKNILLEIYHHPLMPELVASFPISAIDGTLEKRMVYSPINSKGHFKTGSLRDVNGIAGFFQNEKKEMILFVFIINDKKSDLSLNLQEKLINRTFYLN